MAPAGVIDADQHLFESRTTWSEYIDPEWRDDALAITDDAQGWPWLTWRSTQLYPADGQIPGRPELVGRHRVLQRGGAPAPASYEDLIPDAYGGARARAAQLEALGLAGSFLFPNYGLIWERMLAADPAARRANMRAYNRWMSEVTSGLGDRLFGVAHLVLDDPVWVRQELERLAAEGIRLAMIAPAPVNGRSLSHPDLEPVWRAFCDTGLAPVFHVAGFESPLHPAWHDGDPEPGDQLLDSVFLSLAPSLALANMIVHGVFDRFPGLRIGVVELTAGWVPSFLLHLDGASDFYAARHGGPFFELARRPSEYFLDHVRVSALPYESPARLVQSVGEDTFMIGSDWPHAEGVADPLAEAERAADGLGEPAREKLLASNARWLLGLDG
jgi:predicted TIM-barrel fold metal-dependent hydrolase